MFYRKEDQKSPFYYLNLLRIELCGHPNKSSHVSNKSSHVSNSSQFWLLFEKISILFRRYVEGIMRTTGDELVVVDGRKKLQIPTYLSHTQPRIFDSTMAKNIPIFEPPVWVSESVLWQNNTTAQHPRWCWDSELPARSRRTWFKLLFSLSKLAIFGLLMRGTMNHNSLIVSTGNH